MLRTSGSSMKQIACDQKSLGIACVNYAHKSLEVVLCRPLRNRHAGMSESCCFRDGCLSRQQSMFLEEMLLSREAEQCLRPWAGFRLQRRQSECLVCLEREAMTMNVFVSYACSVLEFFSHLHNPLTPILSCEARLNLFRPDWKCEW